MAKGEKVAGEVVGLNEGARGATGVWPTAGSGVGPLSAKQRWRGLFRRETHVLFWKGVGVRFPHAARLRKLVHCGCRIPLPG
jgi:hypothetical protein